MITYINFFKASACLVDLVNVHHRIFIFNQFSAKIVVTIKQGPSVLRFISLLNKLYATLCNILSTLCNILCNILCSIWVETEYYIPVVNLGWKFIAICRFVKELQCVPLVSLKSGSHLPKKITLFTSVKVF